MAIPVETYTAKRAYQIASEYRKRGVPVVMGGFHATLAPEEVARYAESVVLGEAENVWARGHRRRAPRPAASAPTAASERPALSTVRYDRRLFRGRRYLPIGLIETGRGCKFPCEFCAVQTFFERTARHRPIDAIVAELRELKDRHKLFFFVDDNFAANLKFARELVVALAAVKVRWVTQMSINAAHDEEFLATLSRSGCQGVLIGFESLDDARAQVHAQELQHHARRLRGGAGESAPPQHPRVRHLRVRL